MREYMGKTEERKKDKLISLGSKMLQLSKTKKALVLVNAVL